MADINFESFQFWLVGSRCDVPCAFEIGLTRVKYSVKSCGLCESSLTVIDKLSREVVVTVLRIQQFQFRRCRWSQCVAFQFSSVRRRHFAFDGIRRVSFHFTAILFVRPHFRVLSQLNFRPIHPLSSHPISPAVRYIFKNCPVRFFFLFSSSLCS